MWLGHVGRGSGTAGSWWPILGRRRANGVVAVAAVIVVAALVVVGLQLHGTQASTHQRVISHFHDRAAVISALTQAVLESAAASSEATRKYGGATVRGDLLDQAVAEGHLAYAVLLDQRGRVIAASRTLTPSARAQVLSSAALKPVLTGAAVSLSDVLLGGPRRAGVIALSVSLQAAAGRRVLVSGVPTSLFSAFLGSYLRRVPTRDGTAYVADSRGDVVAAREARTAAGTPVAEPGLLRGMQRGSGGSFGRDGYFVAVPVPASTWRVVLTSSKSSLFSSVSGSRKWLPWVMYVALGIVALGFLALLRRLLGSAAALSTANGRLASSNARLESSNALLRKAAELERSNAELEQFASLASHDLQEPLRKLQTFAAQLTATESERLSEQGQDFLGRMSTAAGRMRALIDDLLMFSRVATKGRPFVMVDLDDVIAQVLVDLELKIEETGANVLVGDLPTIAADPVQMRQLLQNLLENGLKFRRDGVVPDIGVRARVTDGIAELTIEDNGLGFEAQYATRIFRAFERLHGTSAYPGTGIGLALCRKIVERHHGVISAESDLGGGATFTVRLPIEHAADSAPPVSLFPEMIGEEASHALT
jgi:signal transduction histidine kinase